MNDLLAGLNIYLIGIMGVGKSTVGKALASQLGYRFFDTDTLIERVAGQSIQEIFATQGESNFRQLESQVLNELSVYTKSAIATGGGIVLKTNNWSHLHQGLIVWLDTPVELIVQRLKNDNTRPLLNDGDLSVRLTALLAERKSLYAQADLHVKIDSERTSEQIAADIIELIPTVLKSSSTHN